MSAPVIKQHLKIIDEIRVGDRCMRFDITDAQAAQLIADSEALACAELRALVGTIRSQLNLIPRNVGDITPAEHSHETGAAIDQLRAEVERLKKQIKDDNRSYGCELRDPYGTIWEQATKDHDRAGKAERALAELREWQAGVIANERLHHAERKEAIARAEKAEAELAGIRALADRRNKRYHVEDTTHQLVAALDQALDIAQAELATERARVDQLILTHPLYDSRDQLDAAMKDLK